MQKSHVHVHSITTFCRAVENCVGQVEIKGYLPYLASALKGNVELLFRICFLYFSYEGDSVNRGEVSHHRGVHGGTDDFLGETRLPREDEIFTGTNKADQMGRVEGGISDQQNGK